jgi:hypothetical protein
VAWNAPLRPVSPAPPSTHTPAYARTRAGLCGLPPFFGSRFSRPQVCVCARARARAPPSPRACARGLCALDAYAPESDHTVVCARRHSHGSICVGRTVEEGRRRRSTYSRRTHMLCVRARCGAGAPGGVRVTTSRHRVVDSHVIACALRGCGCCSSCGSDSSGSGSGGSCGSSCGSCCSSRPAPAPARPRAGRLAVRTRIAELGAPSPG